MLANSFGCSSWPSLKEIRLAQNNSGILRSGDEGFVLSEVGTSCLACSSGPSPSKSKAWLIELGTLGDSRG